MVQNFRTGVNDLTGAKAASYRYVIKEARNEDLEREFYSIWERSLGEKIAKFGDSAKAINIELFSQQLLQAAFSDDIRNDLALIQIAIMLVAVYTILILGTFSPVHCRLVVALLGLVSVGLSYASGFGLTFYLGGETAGVHNLMPFLLIGIGVDDMFVICNAIDQTDFKAHPHERIRKAISHAGPSITITSMTNALAFAFGSLQSLTSLRSFCIFAAVSIVMLYLTVMSFFLAVVVWDTERVGRKKGECCGLCMCKEDNIICCKGSCLSNKQKAYSNVEFEDAKPAGGNDVEK